MRRILLLGLWQFGLLAGSLLSADTVTLKDGRRISGSVESGNLAELHIKVGDQSQTLDIHQVQAIQFGASPAPSSATGQPNTLDLKDGTHVTGRWWSIDATDVHFLVKDQLQHYPRADVTGVTFGSATGTAPPASPTPTPTPAPATPPQPPPAVRPSRSAPAERGLSQPEEIGAVYFWNGRTLIALERNQAVEHGSGSAPYYEMPAPKSRIRVTEAPTLIFILRLAKGIDPASYSLFPLTTVNGARRTRSQAGRRGALMTWPFDISINDNSSLMTYTLTVRDLPAGEYSFSPSSSNDGYCFGVDPASGQ